MASSPTYCCWIGNIPGNIEKGLIEQYFEEEARNFNNFHSIRVDYNQDHASYQCFINYLDENSMEKATRHFDRKYYCGNNLKAQSRRPKRTSSVPPKSRPRPIENYSETLRISSSKRLKNQIEKKLEFLNQTFSDTNVKLVSEENYDLICKVDSTNNINFDKVVKIIKNWKSFYQAYYLHNASINMDQLRSEILNKFREPSVYIHIKPDKVGISSFDSDLCNDIFNKIKAFISNKIDLVEKINVYEDSERELLQLAIKDKRFLKEKNLLNFRIECRGNEILITGKKASFDKINVLKNLETVKIEQEFVLREKRDLKHAIYKLKSFHRELKKKFLIIKFSQNLSQHGSFEIFGFKFDENHVEKEAAKIKEYLSNVRSVSINLNDMKNIDLIKIKMQLRDFNKKNTKDNDDEGNEDENDVFLSEKKFIFINGTDDKEINQLKESILKLIDGSREITKTINLKNRIYSNYVDKESKFFNEMELRFKNIKIFLDCKRSNAIRLTGSDEDVQRTETRINEFLNSFSNQIVTKGLELKNSEFKYLQSQRDNIEEIKKSAKILIDKSLIRKLISLSLNSTEIELCEGNMINIPADAYVSPANKNLNNNGGLAQLIIEKAGQSIQKECDVYAKSKRFNSGDVIVTGSGKLGVKTNSIIIHAIAPIWENGLSNESDNLAKLVSNSLLEAENRGCESIVIPAISTGIFNYPADKAVEIISETVITYILSKPETRVNRVIFNTDEDSVANIWTRVLKYKANIKKMKIQSNKSNISPSWYWKDDEENWKAFTSDLAEILDNHFKQKNYHFDLNIDRNRYNIDLVQMRQTNKVTGFVHKISNEVPMISKYQWSFENDSDQKSPLSEKHSAIIEKAYKSKEKFIDIELRRHDDDKMETYRYQFCKENTRIGNRYTDNFENMLARIRINPNLSDFESIGTQINLRTGFKRKLFRDEKEVKAEILEVENTQLESRDVMKIFISGIGNNADIAVSKLKKLVEDAYITEKYPLIKISNNELKRLEEENSAVISLTSKNITVKALPDDLNKIKSELLNFSLQHVAISYPSNWSGMNNDTFKIVEIMRNSTEFNEISNNVSKSVSNLQIKKIERVQNTWLWDKYIKTTKFLEDKGTKKNEKWLFHGTGSTG